MFESLAPAGLLSATLLAAAPASAASYIPTDLGDLIDPAAGFILTEARGIDAGGQIVDTGRNAAGAARAFLLTPNVVAAVPAGFGMAGGALHRRRVRVAFA